MLAVTAPQPNDFGTVHNIPVMIIVVIRKIKEESLTPHISGWGNKDTQLTEGLKGAWEKNFQIREIEEEDDMAGMDAPRTDIWTQKICPYRLQAELCQISGHFGIDNQDPTSCADLKAPLAHLYQEGGFSQLHGVHTSSSQYSDSDDSVMIVINWIIQDIDNNEVNKVLEPYGRKGF